MGGDGEAAGPEPPERREVDPDVDLDRIRELWPAIVDHVRGAGAEVLSTILEAARPLGIDDGRVLRIGFPAGQTFAKRKAESKANADQMSNSLLELAAVRLRPVYELMEGEDGEPAAAASAPAMEDDEIIELLKSKFDAREVFEDKSSGEDDAQSREAG